MMDEGLAQTFRQDTIKTLEAMKWHFAKTMPKIPHQYARKREFQNDEKFLQICKTIRALGMKEKFYSKEYIYLYSEKYKYWIMDHDPNDAEIINRAAL